MSREQLSKEEHICILGTKAKGCRTDNKKLNFSIRLSKHFHWLNESTSFVNENIPKNLDDGFYVYANMKKLSETEFEKLKSLTWKEYLENFKIILFDFCILNGDAYTKYFLDLK